MNVYTVQAGDTLETIAKKFLVSVTDLQKWNNGQFPSLYSTTLPMTPGWVINVSPPSRTTYNVTDFGAIGHDITRNDGSVIAGSTSFVSKDGTFKSGDVGTNITVDYAATNTTLSDMLIQGASYSLLTVNPLTTEIASGANVVVQFGTNTQTFVAAATAPIGAIYVTVTAQVANYSYPIGSYVDPANLTTTITSVASATQITLGADATITAYGLTYTYTPDDSAAIQAAIDATVITNGTLMIPPTTGAYTHSSPLTIGGSITVMAYGATLKWTGTQTSLPAIYNTVVGFFNWFGGTYDANGAAMTVWGVGGTGGVALTSSVVKDLTFINVYHGAWVANSISTSGSGYNTHIRWHNIGVVKLSTGDSADLLELVGADVIADVWGVPNGTGAFLITSSWLNDAKIRARTLDLSLVESQESSLMLQAFTSNGPPPYFTDVEIDSNGFVQLTNGNLTSLTEVSDSIVITLSRASQLQVGTSAYDKWESVIANGIIVPKVGNTALNFMNAGSISVNAVIDAINLTSTDQIGTLISLQAAGIVERIYFGSLVVKNLVSGALVNSLIYGGPGFTNPVFQILAGDITEGSAPLAQSSIFGGVKPGTTMLAVRNWIGYNPTGPQAAPSMPASGTAFTNPFPFDTTVYVTGGTVSEIAVGGTSTGLTSGSVYIPAGESITLTYSATPTWVWIGN